MKQMTDYQRELVCQNLDLVDQTIRCRIVVRGIILLTYEDFYQIGCEALCRAALEYKLERGPFAPFACRFIYNAMIDHCRKQNALMCVRHSAPLDADDDYCAMEYMSTNPDLDAALYNREAWKALQKCKEKYKGITLQGIEAMELKSIGYSSREIAERYDTTINNVNAWISRAKTRLRNDPDLAALFA